MNDIALKMDRLLRGTKGIEPSRIIFGGIFQETNTVAADQGSPCGPRESLLG
jgi:hypothetical protein